jgi:integrase
MSRRGATRSGRRQRRRRRGSFLSKAVQDGTTRRYEAARTAFWQYVHEVYETDETITDAATLDVALTDYIVSLFDELPTRGYRQKGLDAKAALAAAYGISHSQLPLAARALKAWDRLVPGVSPPPFSLGLLLLVARAMLMGEADFEIGMRLAMCLILMFEGYLRAGDLLGLREDEIALPGDVRLAGLDGAGIRMDGKTGRNQFVSLNSGLAVSALRWLKLHTLPGEYVCPFTYGQLRYRFKKALAAAGMDTFGFTLHSIRHGGATAAFAAGYSLDHIAMIGRWRCLQSLQRYVQTGRAVLLSLALPQPVRATALALARDPCLLWA